MLEQENAALRANARRERMAREDLERQLLLAKDKRRARVAAPVLPVEVVAPPESDPGQTVMSSSDGEPYAVVGIDQDGQEIVYVGDAARSSEQPTIVLNAETHPDVVPSASARSPETSRRPPVATKLAPIPADDLGESPTGSDRLEVTREVPTVSRQLERAHARKPASHRSVDRAAEDYRRGYDLLKAGDHEGALAAFEEFVVKYPTHDFADNAQYWLGETHYDRRIYDRAAKAFQVVLDRYPKGNKVPDAMLKLGYCRHSTGDRAGAVRVLQDLVNRYPKTGPAKLARERLEAFAKETP